MKKWSYLVPGDIIDVIAPSSWCSRDEFDGGIRYLASLGFQVRTPKNIFHPDFIYANSAEETLSHLRSAIYAKDSKAIWCARGGAGTFRFISDLNRWNVPPITKMFIGLSDITTMHIFLNQKWNWPTLHGPMISMLRPSRMTPTEKKDLESIIFGWRSNQIFQNLKPMNKVSMKKRTISGEILGGNLCLVQNSLGTPWQLKTKGKILFFEDIDERGYEVERMLMHLENAKLFDGVRAVVFGEFIGGREKSGADLVKIALNRFAQRMKFPVFKGVKSGHGPIVKTLPFNTRAQLRTGRKGILEVQTGGC